MIIENAPAAVFMLPGADGELSMPFAGSNCTQVASEAPPQSRLLQPPQYRILPSGSRAAAAYIRPAGRFGPFATVAAVGLKISVWVTAPPPTPFPERPPANQTLPSLAAQAAPGVGQVKSAPMWPRRALPSDVHPPPRRCWSPG